MISLNQALTNAPEGSMEIYSSPEFGFGTWNSLNMESLGVKTKILSFANSVPQISTWPENVVVVVPSGCALDVGIAHSLNVPFVGLKYTRLLPENSTNQQHLPDESSDMPTGPLFVVGMVHSVKV